MERVSLKYPCTPSRLSASQFPRTEHHRSALRANPAQQWCPCRSTSTRSTRSTKASSREEVVVEYGEFRARQIKQKLDELGADSSSCFDKESLLNKLADTMMSLQAKVVFTDCNQVIHMDLLWKQAAPLFAGIQTQQGEYMGIQLRFPTLKTGQVPLDFIIDTAASVNVVMPNVASQLGARRTGTTASGIGGTGKLGGSYELALGPTTANNQVFWNDLKAIVMELPTAAGTAGILGLTFLNQCGAVVFKWGSRPGSATLYSRDGTEFMKHAQDLDKISLHLGPNGVPMVHVKINGVRMVALVDTGAAFSCANRASGIAVNPYIEPMLVAGADGNTMKMGISAGGVDIRLDDSAVKFTGVNMLVGDLPAFALLGLPPGTPGIILGLDALMQKPTVVLSTCANCMWL